MDHLKIKNYDSFEDSSPFVFIKDQWLIYYVFCFRVTLFKIVLIAFIREIFKLAYFVNRLHLMLPFDTMFFYLQKKNNCLD